MDWEKRDGWERNQNQVNAPVIVRWKRIATTISPQTRFICLSMNILQRPRDVGQALWKHKQPIKRSLHYVSRLGALPIPAHWSASEPREGEETPVP